VFRLNGEAADPIREPETMLSAGSVLGRRSGRTHVARVTLLRSLPIRNEHLRGAVRGTLPRPSHLRWLRALTGKSGICVCGAEVVREKLLPMRLSGQHEPAPRVGEIRRASSVARFRGERQEFEFRRGDPDDDVGRAIGAGPSPAIDGGSVGPSHHPKG
jgi:hypothetical protein